MLHKFFAKTQFLGKKVVFLPQCHSTNEIAADLISSDRVIEGTTIITPNQTNGKGQRGNTWESTPNQNITFSTILKPTFISPTNQFHLHIITTLAIHSVLFDILGQNLKIKWPNDIYYNKNKLGGILIENSLRGSKIENVIVGIGINVNQIRFDTPQATSLKEITQKEFEPNELIEKILIQLELKYLKLKAEGIDILKKEYLRRLYLYNKERAFEATNRKFLGTITGVSNHGLLQITENQIVHEFNFKEVSFL